jgi:hypothetical protein
MVTTWYKKALSFIAYLGPEIWSACLMPQA